ncbi:MAG: hypothetical protein KF863_10645 [Rubrivivax sp.]|nr:hypothetical protein [Rubrivivax sp.]
MTATAAALSRSWRVGSRTCTLTVPRPQPGAVLAAAIEWQPDVPRRLSEAELRQYRAGRDDALRALAQYVGGAVALVEL